jgi:PAS domain S-box-containing protein/putative nucleotidyltransferase with HDIG domain
MDYGSKNKQELVDEVNRLSARLKKLEKVSRGHAQVKRNLLQSQAHIDQLANLFPNAVFEIDLKGKVVFANDAGLEVFGRTQHDLKHGFSAFDVISAEDHERLKYNMHKVLTGELRLPHQYTGLKKDGTKFPVLVQATRIMQNDKPAGVRGVIMETTRLQQAQELIVRSKEDLEATVRARDAQLKLSSDKLRRVLEQTIGALASAIEKRDPYTAGHQQRVAYLAQIVAKQMGLSSEQVKTVFMASLIHDIGKIYVPAEILSKPAKLNEIEISIIRLHPGVGYEILKPIEFPWPICDVILQHHERINGSGYPHNLKGSEIMIEAKIICVCDVVEAMASHRPYRPALGLRPALEEISANKGVLYDANIVEACLAVVSKDDFHW